jgi:hypothetical protein
MDRVAEYYFVTGDANAKIVLDKWVGWVKANTKLGPGGEYKIPSTMGWSGKPAASWSADKQNWNAKDKAFNADLHVTIKDYGDDAGVASAMARTLSFYAAKSGDKAAQKLAQEILDRMWTKYRDRLGVSTPETRVDFKRFADPVYIPMGWKGKMPNGDSLENGATFLSIRSKYKSDPDWPKVDAYLKGGQAPVFTYHRMWGQSDIAIANATYGWLFGEAKGGDKAQLAAGSGKTSAGGKKRGHHAGK